jgi:hypothetical protein
MGQDSKAMSEVNGMTNVALHETGITNMSQNLLYHFDCKFS